MVTKEQAEIVRSKTFELFEKAHIALTDSEKENLEIADFGLGDVFTTGLELITYVNTERVCAKEMVLLPGQTCPEHGHPPLNGYFGKEETVRCRYGTLYLYVAGESTENPHCQPPRGSYTVRHEIVLNPGEQYTIYPGMLHWMQSGNEGAVFSEFSTKNRDNYDTFTDLNVKRTPVVEQ